MKALATNQKAVSFQANEITMNLCNDFVSFVDRTQKTVRTYLTNLRQFMAWLKYAAIRKPSRKDIISYREWLAAEHKAITFAPDTVNGWVYRTDRNGNPVVLACKPTTIRSYLQAVKAFFSWTDVNNLYPDIARNIHAPKVAESHKKDSLTAYEVSAIEMGIVSHAKSRIVTAMNTAKDRTGKVQRSTEQSARLYAMYLLAVNAGLRTVEISRANIKDLATKGGKTSLFIWGKGHSTADQRKPIAPEVKAAIDAYLKNRTDNPTGNSPLFVATGNRSRGKRLASTTISTMLKKAMQEAGFDSDRLTAHSLRHSTAQNVMELTGLNIYQTQQYLRHSSPKTTEIYLEHETEEQDEQIAAQLYQHFHGGIINGTEREQLESLIITMNPEKLKQLLTVAKAMC